MLALVKKLLGKREPYRYEPDPPGRTYKKILTGQYFGGTTPHHNEQTRLASKENKIRLINEHQLLPATVRYTYKKEFDDTLYKVSNDQKDILSAYVVFQKEVFDEKWNMVHITELSFILYPHEFYEFESMANVSLKENFKDLTAFQDSEHFMIATKQI